MQMKEEQIEIVEFQKSGYLPLVDYETWRVAVLKFCDDLKIENIKTMQKHMETDEVFILLKGQCTLYLGGSGEQPDRIEKVTMLPGKVYNIKKGVWHNHTMDEQGEVVIVENSNTSDDNSPITELTKEQLQQLIL
ncbi:MAG: cupin domain-containing protein [Roseburia sp.]